MINLFLCIALAAASSTFAGAQRGGFEGVSSRIETVLSASGVSAPLPAAPAAAAATPPPDGGDENKALADFYLRMLEDKDSVVRKEAAGKLGDLGVVVKTADIVASLDKILKKDPDITVRLSAVYALKSIGCPIYPPNVQGHPDTVLPVLAAAMERDGSYYVRKEAASALARACWSSERDVTAFVARLLSMFKNDADSQVRIAAAYGLGSIGKAARWTADDLRAGMGADKNTATVRAAAAGALCAMGETVDVSTVVKDLNDILKNSLAPGPRIEAAGALGLLSMDDPDAVITSALITALSDREPYVRSSAIAALSRLGPKAAAALEPLRKLELQETSSSEKDAIARAIAKIAAK